MLKEHISEPTEREKAYAWSTAIGLQAVDGLVISDYLRSVAARNIAGDISAKDASALLGEHYDISSRRVSYDTTAGADIIAARMASVLTEQAFVLTAAEYVRIHRDLFAGVYDYAGRIRDYNFTKIEWVLDGASVLYAGAFGLSSLLDDEISRERAFSYDGLSLYDAIARLAKFVSRLWQAHVFGEGNTRTTAVFLVKYLKWLGFDLTNPTFAANSLYFRNALVRANYCDIKNGVYDTTEYLELFLRNLLLGESNALKNRYLRIHAVKSELQYY